MYSPQQASSPEYTSGCYIDRSIESLNSEAGFGALSELGVYLEGIKS